MQNRFSGTLKRLLLLAAMFLCASPAVAQDSDNAAKRFGGYPEGVSKYLKRINGAGQRRFSFRNDDSGGIEKWQTAARSELRRLIGLTKIEKQAGDHKAKVVVGDEEDCGEFTRRRCTIETEPNVSIPFWLLRPKGDGPFPLAVLPHGHDRRGHDTTAGVYADDAHRRTSLAEDRDVAVQAAKRGFLAIAPATRGLAVDGVPDLNDRHGGRACRSHVMHCLLAGRTAIGERVWDMQRIIDWASRRDDVDAGNVLMMGNSGGGMVTLYAAACDERITVAVASCSFTTLASPQGYIYHCDCNLVPGMLQFGDIYDVAGLSAPRRFLAVNGRHDALHSAADIERSAAAAKAIFAAAGVPDHFDHRWGAEGHRFYSDLMWPFVMAAIDNKKSSERRAP